MDESAAAYIMKPFQPSDPITKIKKTGMIDPNAAT
jgi:hypothetical protein